VGRRGREQAIREQGEKDRKTMKVVVVKKMNQNNGCVLSKYCTMMADVRKTTNKLE